MEAWRQSLRDAGFNAPAGHSFHPSRLIQPGGDRTAARAACERLLEERPGEPEVLAAIVALLQAEGRSGEALRYRRELAAHRVAAWKLDDAGRTACVDYLIAGETGERRHERTPGAYVTALFDAYAGRFDEHLRSELDYRGPELVLDGLIGCGALPARAPAMEGADGRGMGRRVLDLGCGTGLVGAALRPYSSWLEGVDLSSSMLELARARGDYDALVHQDLMEHLAADGPDFDIVSAGEVLIYFGDLAPALRGVFARLRPGGRFVFTLERGDHGDYRLRSTGRFQHERAYAAAVSAEAGFLCEALESVTLRKQDGQAVAGYLMVLFKPD